MACKRGGGLMRENVEKVRGSDWVCARRCGQCAVTGDAHQSETALSWAWIIIILRSPISWAMTTPRGHDQTLARLARRASGNHRWPALRASEYRSRRSWEMARLVAWSTVTLEALHRRPLGVCVFGVSAHFESRSTEVVADNDFSGTGDVAAWLSGSLARAAHEQVEVALDERVDGARGGLVVHAPDVDHRLDEVDVHLDGEDVGDGEDAGEFVGQER